MSIAGTDKNGKFLTTERDQMQTVRPKVKLSLEDQYKFLRESVVLA